MYKGLNFTHDYKSLPRTFWTPYEPEESEAPRIVLFNHHLARLLNIDENELENDAEFFSGNKLPASAEPIAQAYMGHQFGTLNMLGDGRNVLLGEHNTDGEKYDVVLKGSGATKYSRQGDGRAPIDSMLREYIISEYMANIGIATTRALAVVDTGEQLTRQTTTASGILTRIASSHIRVGTFEYAARQSLDDLKALADFAIERHYPYLSALADDKKYLLFYDHVVRKQAELIAQWQSVGFIHGVMNTDNMSISGETIDYGPCAFIDVYNPDTYFSSIDTEGRYRYKNQPPIGQWDLSKLGEALCPLFNSSETEAVKLAQEVLDKYPQYYNRKYISLMGNKLGILDLDYEEQYDVKLVDELLGFMFKYEADYTRTFRDLYLTNYDKLPMFNDSEFINWFEQYQARKKAQSAKKDEINIAMNAANPSFIPRNHLVQKSLNLAVDGHYGELKQLLKAVSKPFNDKLGGKYINAPGKDDVDPDFKTYCGT